MAKNPLQGSPQPPVPEPALDQAVTRPHADPLSIRTMRCRTVAQSGYHHVNYIRELPGQPIQEHGPVDLSGEDGAPNASEALLAALGSCLAMGIHANSMARHITVRALELVLEGDVNDTAVWGAGLTDPQPLGFEAIRVSVHMRAEASDEVLQALVNHATLWSPVANTLYNPVHLDVTLGKPIVS